MFKFLSPLFSGSKKQLKTTELECDAVSVWKDTGKVYYLENTLKLTFESNIGKVTFENLNFEKLSEILKKIEQNNDDLFKQRTVANIKDALTISVCAVTWQQKDDTTRIKAIPNAALLRSKTPDFKNSQAVFRHQHLLEHDDILAVTNTNSKQGVFTYANVSVNQFVTQIESANNRLAKSYKKQISVNQENFNTAFTENEEQSINNLLVQDSHDQSILSHKQDN